MPRCGWCSHYCDLTVPKSVTGASPLIVGVCARERDAGEADGELWFHAAMDEACGAWVPYDPEDSECFEEGE